jgi:hypothetical protein
MHSTKLVTEKQIVVLTEKNQHLEGKINNRKNYCTFVSNGED